MIYFVIFCGLFDVVVVYGLKLKPVFCFFLGLGENNCIDISVSNISPGEKI